MGMVMANALAVRLGLLKPEEARRIEALLRRFGLPTRYRVKDPESFYEQFFLDKKSVGDSIAFVLPKGIGDFEIVRDVPKELVLETLKEFG